MSKKKALGQFYTTNYDYILEGLGIPKGIKTIIEPFAGQGDLIEFAKGFGKYKFECYDIEPKKSFIIERDTLKNPPDYSCKFVLTNPPYLARNKAVEKELFKTYDTDDLYKCFLEELIADPPLGGIVIIPLNFWCTVREKDISLRKRFLQIFSVLRLNIFEEQVFSDTSYTVCSFQFEKKEDEDDLEIQVKIFPGGKEFRTFIDSSTNYTFGGEMYTLKQDPNIQVDRLTRKNCEDEEYITDILVKCIDDSKNSIIGLKMVKPEERYLDDTKNLSARSYATLVIKPKLSRKEQEKLVERFNEFLTEKREQYNSLFLTNYRESKDIARKRISFRLIYQIVNFLLTSPSCRQK